MEVISDSDSEEPNVSRNSMDGHELYSTDQLDHIIESLLSIQPAMVNGVRRITTHVDLTERCLNRLCNDVKKMFLEESTLLEVNAPINILSDIHGHFYDLLEWFNKVGLPPNESFLFLGDYVDRGTQSIEVVSLLFALKLRHPKNIFLIRGNHEYHKVNINYGFYDECKERYNTNLWKRFSDTFNSIPLAAVVEKKIFCVHAGLSPKLKDVNQIKSITRPTIIPVKGIICDLVWSDPVNKKIGWKRNRVRKISYYYGTDVIEKFTKNNNLDLICRGHEFVKMGYKFYANKKLVSVFSVPHYCNATDNIGAIMTVDENLVCTFSTLAKQHSHSSPIYMYIFKKAETTLRFNIKHDEEHVDEDDDEYVDDSDDEEEDEDEDEDEDDYEDSDTIRKTKIPKRLFKLIKR